MAAKLKVLKNGLVVDEKEIKHQALLIGKGDHCDLVLNFPGVGREMMRMTAEKDGFYLTDVSVQGVTVDGQRITKHKLLPGQEVTCGSVQIVLEDDQAAVLGDDGEISSSATVIWGASALGMAAAGADAGKAYLIDESSPESIYEVSGDEVVIGRRQGQATLVFSDRSMSGRHARIATARGRFLLADLNSTNGTFLNGVKVSEPVELNDGDRIKMGGLFLIFRRSLQPGQKSQPHVVPPPLIDMAQIAVMQTDLMPETPPSASAGMDPARRRRLLLLGFVFALLAMFLIIMIGSGSKAKIDLAEVAAVETMIREGRLDDAEKKLVSLKKAFPQEPRLKLLSDQLAEALSLVAAKAVSGLAEQARAREAAGDILGAVQLWAAVLDKNPDDVPTQQKLSAAAYRIALVYEGRLPQPDIINATRHLELVQKHVKKENGADYDAAIGMLGRLKGAGQTQPVVPPDLTQ